MKAERRILALDGFRALAILSVMAYHYTVRWAPPYDPAAHLPAGAMFAGVWPLYFGWTGVEFFFVISGFVILMTLENTASAWDFIVRRFARIWPALLVAATITAAVVLAIGPPDWRVDAYDFVDSIFLVGPNVIARVFGHDVKYVDGAYWSLWVEVRFYLLAVAIFYLTRPRFLAFWIAVQLAVFALATLWRSELFDLLLFPDFLPYFTLGICIYKLHGNKELGLARIGAGVAAAAILYNALAGNFDTGLHDLATEASRLAFTGINLLIFALFWLFLADSPLLRPFASRPAARLGQASYSLYLLHQALGVTIIGAGVGLGIPYLAMIAITLALMIGLALAMYAYVEVPAKRAIVSAFGHHRHRLAIPG